MKKRNLQMVVLCFVFSMFAVAATSNIANADYEGDIPVVINNDNPHATEAEKWLMKSSGSLDQGLWEEAIRNATIAIYYDQTLSAAFISRAQAYTKAAKYKEAILDCNYVLRIEPDNVEAFHYRGLAYYLLGEKRKGLKDYHEACEMGFDPSCKKFQRITGYLPSERIKTLLQWSLDKFSEGDFNEVIDLSDQVIEAEPENYEALSNRCGANASIENFSSAQPDCEKAISLNPDFSMAYNNLGYVLEKTGEIKEAISNYEKSCNLTNALGCQNLHRLQGDNQQQTTTQ